MKVLSLFDGISCGREALSQLGIKVDKYDAYEIDENAITISKYNWSDITYKGDVFNAKYYPAQYDLLIGGSPCTYWSTAQNKKTREITSDGFGFKLFKEYVRALYTVNPKYFLYENNYSMNKNIRDEITKYLGVEPICIDSALVSGQSRRRLYWTNIPNVSQPKKLNIKFSEIINWNEKEFRPLGNWVYGYYCNKRRIDMLKDITAEKSNCLTTKKGHNFNYYLNKDHTMYCNLSVEEYEMLQTLPIGYCSKVPICDTAKYKAIGNCWTINVIVHILKNMEGNV